MRGMLDLHRSWAYATLVVLTLWPSTSAAAAAGVGVGAATAPAAPPVTFDTNFEGGSIGRIEVVGPAEFRCHVAGQCDERGHNRQASWYYFRLRHADGRAIALTLTDFVGEYDDKPGAVAMGPGILPVFSTDGSHWTHFTDGWWDDKKKELTLHFTPAGEELFIAHVPPYTPADLGRLLADVSRSADARVEVIGRTCRGREIPMVTVTDFATPDDGKRFVWLQARQHAWEAGTSYVMEGALRFITSVEDPAARELRRTTVFHFTPMVDLDGCASGGVRFNANGYDVNRHWPEVDLRRPEMLRLMPEIWYTKKAIVSAQRERPIDVLVNLHNTETGEFMQTEAAADSRPGRTIRRLFDLLSERTTFDPSQPLVVRPQPGGQSTTLYSEHQVPIVLLEQRIAVGKKLGRRPTVEDRLAFGRQLVAVMVEAARAE